MTKSKEIAASQRHSPKKVLRIHIRPKKRSSKRERKRLLEFRSGKEGKEGVKSKMGHHERNPGLVRHLLHSPKKGEGRKGGEKSKTTKVQLCKKTGPSECSHVVWGWEKEERGENRTMRLVNEMRPRGKQNQHPTGQVARTGTSKNKKGKDLHMSKWPPAGSQLPRTSKKEGPRKKVLKVRG